MVHDILSMIKKPRLKKFCNDTRLAKVDHMDFLVLDSQENDARLLDVHVYAMNVS